MQNWSFWVDEPKGSGWVWQVSKEVGNQKHSWAQHRTDRGDSQEDGLWLFGAWRECVAEAAGRMRATGREGELEISAFSLGQGREGRNGGIGTRQGSDKRGSPQGVRQHLREQRGRSQREDGL